MTATTKARSSHGNFAPLRAVDLVKEMVEQLRAQILAGRYGVDGELPPESQLSEAFGVSRTVAREAMRTLRTQGLVEVSRGRRPRVKPVDTQVAVDSLQALLIRSGAALTHLGEIRRVVEVEIAGMAAERATAEEIQAMQEAIDEQQAARSVKKQIEADHRFHELLARASRNPLFPLLLSTIGPLLHESRRRTISRVGTERAIEGHIKILDAVARRASEEARQAMRVHLCMAEEDLAPAK